VASKYALAAHSRRSLIQCVRSMDNGTTGRLAHGPRSIAIVGHATGYLFTELRGYCRTALLGRRLLPVIRTFDRRRRGMRIARAIDSMPQLRRQLVPTVRSRVERGRFSTGVDQPTQGVSWVNVQPGLADQTTPLSSPTLSLIRALVAALVLIALIPNLMLGAIFWLGAVDIPWPRSPTITANDKTVAPPSAVPTPVLSSPPTLEASAGGDITLPIALDGTDGVPARSIIVIKGLPQGSKLSSGRPYDETEWNLKPDEIGDLHLALTGNESSEANVIIQLVAPNGAIIADAATVLKVTTDSNIKAELAQPQVRDVQAEGLGAIGGQDKVANVDVATTAPVHSVPLPSRRPVPTANDDGADWIKALAFVNLRQRPTRSAPAISVVEKGAKLRVMGRKKGWLLVSNPATSERGWIYAANIAAVR